jgi:maltose O-acetyltransferase
VEAESGHVRHVPRSSGSEATCAATGSAALYIADAPELAEQSARARRLAHQLNTSDSTDSPRHRAILTELLAALGEGSEIRPPFYCHYGYQTSIGARCFANWGLVSLDAATVTIGNDVQIGPNVQLLIATHAINPGLRLDKWETAEPIATCTMSCWVAA